MGKFQELESAVISLDNRLKGLEKTLQGVINTTNSNSKSQTDLAAKTKAVTKATDQISAVEKELENIRKRSAKTTKETIAAREQLRQKTKALTDAERKQQGTLKKSGGLFKSMTKSILAAGAAMLSFRAAFLVIKNGFKTIVQFEKGMSAVKAITGASVEAFKALQENALLLGRTTSKTATQVAELQVEFAKLGFSTAEILAATEATIQLSIAAGTDLAEAAVVAASTVRGFGLSATETQRVVDVMAKSFSSSALDLEKFKVAMSKVAPVAKASGKTLEFATSRLAILSDAGLEASIAGTSLRNIFLELNKQGLTWEEGLEKINTSTNKNVTALNLFGKRGATAALILADNVEKAGELEVALDGAAGSAKDMADIMEDNLAGDIKKAASAWEGFILGLNDGTGALAKAGRNVIKFGTNAIRSLNTLDLWFKSEKRFTSDDFDRLLENMDFVKTESGKTVREIVDNFEELNKGLSTEDLLKRGAEFKNLFKAEGETVKSSLGLWAAYTREREGQIQIEKDAILAAEQAAIDAAAEAARIKAALAEEAAKKQDKETQKNIERLKKELAAKEALQLKAKQDSDALADSLVNEEIKLTDDEIERLTKQLDEEFKLQQEAAEKEIELAKKVADEEEELRQKKLENISNTLQLVDSATQEIFSLQQSLADSEISNLERQRDAEIAAAEKAGKDTSKIEAKYAKKEAKLRNDQAKKEKAQALFSIGLNTAIAAVASLAANPLPAGAAVLALTLALGAIQLGVAAAKPIPKFKHGSNGQLQLDTTAIVGDGGKPELITTPKGDFLSPSTDTMVHLPRGSQVFGGDSPETQAALSGGMTQEMYQGLRKEQQLTRKAIQNQKQAPYWTGKGLNYRDEARKADILWIKNTMR
jgi:hypothetical protein